MSFWYSPRVTPKRRGWYVVRRSPDDEAMVRAYGNGHWWIPLPGGWLSADGVYRWMPGAVKGLPKDTALVPLAEHDAALARAKKKHPRLKFRPVQSGGTVPLDTP